MTALCSGESILVKINRWSVVMIAKKKMAVFWDVAPCSLVDID